MAGASIEGATTAGSGSFTAAASAFFFLLACSVTLLLRNALMVFRSFLLPLRVSLAIGVCKHDGHSSARSAKHDSQMFSSQQGMRQALSAMFPHLTHRSFTGVLSRSKVLQRVSYAPRLKLTAHLRCEFDKRGVEATCISRHDGGRKR